MNAKDIEHASCPSASFSVAYQDVKVLRRAQLCTLQAIQVRRIAAVASSTIPNYLRMRGQTERCKIVLFSA